MYTQPPAISSQMLVLPPYQRRGLGTHLLQAVYTYYRHNVRVLDITVEDPSENFTQCVDVCV